MSGFTPIDLSKLPAPEVIQTVAYETLLAEMKAEAIIQMPELEPYLALESEPVTKLLRVCAYHRMLDRLEFNDGARANMLALSTGTDLDGLAAYWGVVRLVAQEADDSVSPPIAQIMESDDALRQRVQLSLEGHSTAGPRGSYIFWARSASGEIKDVSVISEIPGQVTVTVLSHDNDGTPSNSVLNAVETVLNGEDVRPLTDQVVVQAATLIPYQITAELVLFSGPDSDTVLDAAQAAIATYITEQNRLGFDITLSGIYSALHQPGVQKVNLTEPLADIVVGDTEAAYCPIAPALSLGGTNV
ncbi:baseplate assembly protein [Parasedimentitalea marina]|uniref:Baseplate assembly protein n=1 Tax=Parasedimentitalea marina TaxID=2483033 RepID=A0A3T0N1J7_9RHOB|nr:baseplate J/gp47 family protein [Parasedimentitalea marina]AZV77886.1 baseplate assembly protein [Parasedimentitalea marina]